MKHSILSVAMLLGFGLTTGMAFFGGGNIHYVPEPDNTDIRQSDSDGMGTKTATRNMDRQPTEKNYAAVRCVDAQGNACADHYYRPAQ